MYIVLSRSNEYAEGEDIMADIKCSNDHCPLAESCYRKTAPDSMRQSWVEFQYVERWNSAEPENRAVVCDSFIASS